MRTHGRQAMKTTLAPNGKYFKYSFCCQARLWASSKQLPGQFTGSTGAQIMSFNELIGPNKRNQAWAKKVRVAYL